jgi:Fe-coproporphyrin III synthase
MIGISRLYCGREEPMDELRYGRAGSPPAARTLRKPVVVFNCTQACNLRCIHCYSASSGVVGSDELSAAEAMKMLDDLADYGVPVVLFSGGEPLARPDTLDLIAYARSKGLRTVLSTNGTRIDADTAARLVQANVDYVGVSLDGLAATHDSFRGGRGAFDAAIGGIRNCRARGIKVGLRLTMTGHNICELGGIFDLIETEQIGRVCFYHLVHAGRGAELAPLALSHEQTRAALDLILARTAALHQAGKHVEVLTVDNHADGPYLLGHLERENPIQAARALALLKANGGNASGQAIGCVSWNGDVHPDQFWRQHVLGNVRKQPFSVIWSDPPADSLLAQLRGRQAHLHGRCRRCRWLDICNGNLRARAEAAGGDVWGDDPACYLSDSEIS